MKKLEEIARSEGRTYLVIFVFFGHLVGLEHDVIIDMDTLPIYFISPMAGHDG